MTVTGIPEPALCLTRLLWGWAASAVFLSLGRRSARLGSEESPDADVVGASRSGVGLCARPPRLWLMDDGSSDGRSVGLA